MKKLGKKLHASIETIESYCAGCTCTCFCACGSDFNQIADRYEGASDSTGWGTYYSRANWT